MKYAFPSWKKILVKEIKHSPHLDPSYIPPYLASKMPCQQNASVHPKVLPSAHKPSWSRRRGRVGTASLLRIHKWGTPEGASLWATPCKTVEKSISKAENSSEATTKSGQMDWKRIFPMQVSSDKIFYFMN